MAPVRANGKPGVVEVERWFAVLVALVTIGAVVFGVLRGAILDNQCIRQTAVTVEKHDARLFAVEGDVTGIKAALPAMQQDLRDIKNLLMERK